MSGFVDQVKDNWPIVSGFALGLIAWGRSLRTQSDHERRLAQVEFDHRETSKLMTAHVVETKESIAKIEVHHGHLSKSLETLVSELKERK